VIPDELLDQGTLAILAWLDLRLAEIERLLALPEIRLSIAQSADPPELDRHRRTILVAGETRYFSPKPWEVFELLFRRRGRPVAKETLIGQLWPQERLSEPDDAEHTLRMHIATVRQILRGSPWEIVGRKGFGWELVERD
jgi:DNA-binding response OmpR family regulator